MTNNETARPEFTLTWTLDAPPADVFRAWTDPHHLDWFYNDAYPVPIEPIELGLRVGGVWRLQMVVDESTAYFTAGSTSRSCPTRGSCSPGEQPAAGRSSIPTGSTRARASP